MRGLEDPSKGPSPDPLLLYFLLGGVYIKLASYREPGDEANIKWDGETWNWTLTQQLKMIESVIVCFCCCFCTEIK